MGESKLLLALFCNKILTKTERGVVVVVFSVPFGCVTLTVTLQHYSGGECVLAHISNVWMALYGYVIAIRNLSRETIRRSTDEEMY